MPDRPDLLSDDDVAMVADGGYIANGEDVLAVEVQLAREVIALCGSRRLWRGRTGWWWLNNEVRTDTSPLADVRPDLSAYLDALEALDG